MSCTHLADAGAPSACGFVAVAVVLHASSAGGGMLGGKLAGTAPALVGAAADPAANCDNDAGATEGTCSAVVQAAVPFTAAPAAEAHAVAWTCEIGQA